MAHEISVLEDGTVEAMFANKPAWHSLGQIFDQDGSQAPDSETALDLAHLDWTVDLAPVHVAGKVVPNYWATVRQDNQETLGIVGGRYTVVQNKESFAFLDSLLQDGVMRYESAFALRGGREVCVLARLPKADQIAEGDVSLRYIMFSTCHDGTGSIRAIPTSVRVVCANTRRLALDIAARSKVGFSVRHTANLEQRLNIVRQYLSQFDAQFTLFRDKASLLATKRYSTQDKLIFLGKLFPQPVKNDILVTSGRAFTTWQNKRTRLEGCLRSSANSLPSIEGTFWSLYNAVSEAVDHYGSYKGSSLQRAENRYMSVIDGSGAALKDEAFALALAMAA